MILKHGLITKMFLDKAGLGHNILQDFCTPKLKCQKKQTKNYSLSVNEEHNNSYCNGNLKITEFT